MARSDRIKAPKRWESVHVWSGSVLVSSDKRLDQVLAPGMDEQAAGIQQDLDLVEPVDDGAP